MACRSSSESLTSSCTLSNGEVEVVMLSEPVGTVHPLKDIDVINDARETILQIGENFGENFAQKTAK